MSLLVTIFGVSIHLKPIGARSATGLAGICTYVIYVSDLVFLTLLRHAAKYAPESSGNPIIFN